MDHSSVRSLGPIHKSGRMQQGRQQSMAGRGDPFSIVQVSFAFVHGVFFSSLGADHPKR
ncbi:hypothetical protein Kim5_PD00109 (plasmid) [Rhizobium sp. Kim5]|nr:hypothetical protein Kim5_PD00109 [Rhizobium sp. Kim5]